MTIETKQKLTTLADLQDDCLGLIAARLDQRALCRWSQTAKRFRDVKKKALRACITSGNLHLIQDFKFVQSITIIHQGQISTEQVAFHPTSLKLISGLDIRARSLNYLAPVPLNQLRNLEAVGHLIRRARILPRSLEVVDLTCNRIRTLHGFARLRGLEVLHLGQNALRNIKPLSRLTNLRHLSLYHNQITDFSPLANLTNLIHLNLSGNPESDLSFLEKLTKLEYLSLQGFNIQNAELVSHLTQLTYLDLSKNRIGDVEPLLTLQQLVTLYLCRNPITNPGLLVRLPKLSSLRLGPSAGYAVFQAARNLRRKGVNVRCLMR